MSDNPVAVEQFIRDSLAQGTAMPEIRQTLLQAGWQTELVDASIAAVQGPPAPAPAPAPAAPVAPVTPAEPAPSNAIASANSAAPASPALSAPVKYGVFRAIKEAVVAIKTNILAYLVVGAVAFIAAIVTFIAVITIIILIFLAGVAAKSTAGLIWQMLGVLTLLTIWSAVSWTMLLTSTAIIVDDGADGQKSHIGEMFKRTLNRAARVALANVLVMVTAVWPLGLTIVLPAAMVMTGHVTAGGAPLVLAVAIGALIWSYIALLRYALVPLVAIFEDIPIINTLGRSRHLLQHGGQWFVIKGALLIFALAVVLAAVTRQNLQQIQASNNPVIGISGLLLMIIVNAALVMLYRNRRAVRG